MNSSGRDDAGGLEYDIVYWPRPVRGRPLLRLDEDGLECAVGRVSWTDVERVTFVAAPLSEGGSRRKLLLKLFPDARLLPVSASYDSGSGEAGVRQVRTELELPLWTTLPDAVLAIRRFYGGTLVDRVESRTRWAVGDPRDDPLTIEELKREQSRWQKEDARANERLRRRKKKESPD